MKNTIKAHIISPGQTKNARKNNDTKRDDTDGVSSPRTEQRVRDMTTIKLADWE